MNGPTTRWVDRGPGFVIRAVTLADVPSLAALHAACFADGAGGAVWGAAAIARILELPGTHGILILNDGIASRMAGPKAETAQGMPQGMPLGTLQGTPLGLALGRVAADEAEVLTLGVTPRARRAGLGQVLLGALMAQARAGGAARLYLEVAEDNAAALRLYLSAAFIRTGRRPGYYRRSGAPVAALVLARNLPLPAENPPVTK